MAVVNLFVIFAHKTYYHGKKGICKAYCCLQGLFKDFKKELPRKSQKTPKAEIEKAKRIMNEYYEQKNK